MDMAVTPQTSTNPMNLVDASQTTPTGAFAPRLLIGAPPLPTFDTPDPLLSSTDTAETPQAPSRIAIDTPQAPLPSSTNVANIPQGPVYDFMVDVDSPMDHLGSMNTRYETPYGVRELIIATTCPDTVVFRRLLICGLHYLCKTTHQ